MQKKTDTRSFFGICSAKSSRHQFVIPKCRFKEKIWIFLFDSKVLKSTRGTLFLTSTSRALWRNMQRRFQFHFPHSTEQLGKTKEENPQQHWQKKKRKKIHRQAMGRNELIYELQPNRKPLPSLKRLSTTPKWRIHQATTSVPFWCNFLFSFSSPLSSLSSFRFHLTI